MHILYLRVSEKNSRRIRNYKIHYSEKVYRDIPAFQTFEIVHMHTRIFPALTEFASLPRVEPVEPAVFRGPASQLFILSGDTLPQNGL